MKRTLLLSMIAAGLIASPLAFAEERKDGAHEGKHHKGAMMEEVDTNGDGLISKAEFMSKHEGMFTKIDADADGSLSKDEMKAAWDVRKEKMKERREERQDKKAAIEGAEGDAPETDAVAE